jgi:H+/Cl- antiporter ClcA/CBS domain-containing protein
MEEIMEKRNELITDVSTTDGLPLAPSLAPALRQFEAPRVTYLVDQRVLFICCISGIVAVISALTAKGLMCLIGLITNLSFYGRLSSALQSPADNHLGWWIVLVPVMGGVVVGLMARYGSSAIRGHGIPEAMEQVLTNDSRINARITFLKPLSAAVAIGTGGPFGAEGPIIATGGAIGSLAGQFLSTSPSERKTLLAAGAAAGMAATFGCPVAATLLAIELLLFEFRPRSFIPVALASAIAGSVRFMLHLPYPVFDLSSLAAVSQPAMAFYLVLGLIVGVASVVATRAVYFVEDMFVASHIHWMWCPAIGGLVVGVIGHFYPQTLGVGYENISQILLAKFTIWSAASLCLWKFISWSAALGSGTSGGTLAPLFTIGGALGLILGIGVGHLLPQLRIDPSVAALVGMAAMFAGASRALLTSVVFAVETTLQPLGLLPLIGGCTMAYVASSILMRNTIMTEKVVRRGVFVPSEYVADALAQVRVCDVASHEVTSVSDTQTVAELREKINSGDADWSHQGFPVLDAHRHLLGVLTRRDINNPAVSFAEPIGKLIHRAPIVVYEDLTLREAANHMINHDVGRLPVVQRHSPHEMVGIVTRSDLLRAQRRRITELRNSNPTMTWWHRGERRRGSGARMPIDSSTSQSGQ